MAYLYRLNGEWDLASTNIFMKAMFCREVNYSNISEESVVFLKEWASLGAPFALTDYEKINDDFLQEFSINPANFIKGFLDELKILTWSRENYNIFIATVAGKENVSGFQTVLIKLIRNLIGDKCDNIAMYEPIRMMQCKVSDINYFLENHMVKDDDEEILFAISNEHNDLEKEGI